MSSQPASAESTVRSSDVRAGRDTAIRAYRALGALAVLVASIVGLIAATTWVGNQRSGLAESVRR